MRFGPVTGIKKTPWTESENYFSAKLKVAGKGEMQNLDPRVFDWINTRWKLWGIQATPYKQKGTRGGKPTENS